jgi:hypothetical protein
MSSNSTLSVKTTENYFEGAFYFCERIVTPTSWIWSFGRSTVAFFEGAQ